MTLEDEHRLVNVIVRPDVYTRYCAALRDQPLVAIPVKPSAATDSSTCWLSAL
jgi:hypothetical protein